MAPEKENWPGNKHRPLHVAISPAAQSLPERVHVSLFRLDHRTIPRKAHLARPIAGAARFLSFDNGICPIGDFCTLLCGNGDKLSLK